MDTDILESDNKAAKGKKGKKNRKKDDWEDEVAREIELMHIESNIPTNSIQPKDLPESTNINDSTNATENNENKAPEKKEPESKENFNKKGKKGNKENEKDFVKEINKEEKDEKSSKDKPEKKGKNENSISKKAETKSNQEPKKKKKEEEPKSKKGPGKKMLAAMREALAKAKEEEEKIRRAEEERERLEEERIRKLEEQKRIEEEKKERQRQKQKERIKRLKEEGRYLTPKQKMEQKRAQAMLEHFKAMGGGHAMANEGNSGTKPTPIKKPKKKKPEVQAKSEEERALEVQEDKALKEIEGEMEGMEGQEGGESEESENIKEAWDEVSDSEEDLENELNPDQDNAKAKESSENGQVVNNVKEMDESSDEGETEEHHTELERVIEKAKTRMQHRKQENEKKRSLEKLRAPVVCVLGHVDHGKTKILDKLRRTNVQEGEVGGITQQIGATNVPAEAIINQTRMAKEFDISSIKFPGLLIIDTPGHESFINLRSRGSSLCDIAILVVDITQGLEPQTIESITLLKKRKTPFIVALNKVDRIYEWVSFPNKDIRESIKMQSQACLHDFERRTSGIIQALNMQGLNAALFWENPDVRSYVSLVPTSAISGDGMGNLIALICDLCQKRLAPSLMFSEELQCTVLEVKTIQGHGTTIDVILINGRLKEGDTIILAGTEKPIVTQIRSLLLPKPMKEIRVKGQYDEFKEIQAAQGVKIAAKGLEKAIAGLNMQVALHDDEVRVVTNAVDAEFKSAMRAIKVKDKGVYVQASTLGALEALLEFFKKESVPYSGIRVGPVVKKDVMKAAAMLEHDAMYAVILAFDVKVERDAQELADKEGVKIFSEETIYHLGDRYVEYIKEYKRKKQEENRHIAVFPCRIKVIPTAIFNKRDPIVLGVSVDSGVLRTGTPLCVPSKEFVEIGVVTSMEYDHKTVELAKKGVDVCIKIENLPGHTPKLFGRHFEATDVIVSKISRESINACKAYFRDDLSKTDWKLMAELKKEFHIL